MSLDTVHRYPQAASLAHYLSAAGVRRGARVGVLCGNAPEVRARVLIRQFDILY
jgi:hypothetical protein